MADGVDLGALGASFEAGLLWISIVLLALSLLVSTLSALIERSGPIRLRHWTEEAEGRLRRCYEQPARFEAFRLLLSALAKLVPVALMCSLAGWLGEAGLVDAAEPAVVWAAVLLIPVIVANEIGNRFLVAWDPERALERLTPVYRLLALLLTPLIGLAVMLFPEDAARRRAEQDEEEATEDEIEAFIDVGTREGILEPGEGEMVWGIVDFSDTAVRSVMTPRIDVWCAPVDSDLDELADRFVESGHSRLPLYESSPDHIVGILHIRDLLRGLHAGAEASDGDGDGAGPRPSARSLSNPPFFVPETKPLGQLLKELQARFQQMAVVVDEYGGTAGIVTVEDLVEEIVGELVDEHEEAHPENELLADGAWRLAGSSDVDVLEELFGVDLGEVPYETVGGMVFSLHGDVPAVGDMVEGYGLRYTVEEVEERRVSRVRVEPLVTAGRPRAGRGGENVSEDQDQTGAVAGATRFGTVALIGRPNAGKSTLMNRLLDEKLAIVSDKPQTTRHRLVGILSAERGQMVFYDTPGVHKPLHRMNKQMVRYAVDALDEADVVCLLVDATQRFGSGDQYMVELLERTSRPKLALLNKIDRVSKPSLLPTIARYADSGLFQEVVPISALSGDGCDRLLDLLWGLLPEGPPAYDPELLTLHPERFLAAERIREKILEHTRDELPFATAVLLETWEEAGSEEGRGLIKIGASILVEKPGQKKILIGRGGSMIKTIGTEARLDLEQYLESRVFLDLHVRVEEDWRERRNVLADIDREILLGE